LVLVERLHKYLGHLKDADEIASYRITRRKLGLAPRPLAEFHVMIEVRDLAQLDRAFKHVASRAGVVEEFHAAVNQWATDTLFALYRDFPDPVRQSGEERF
jgi:hypothetical protein